MTLRTLAIAAICFLAPIMGLSPASAVDQPFQPPASPRAIYSFDRDWKFIREDVAGAQAPEFNDAGWKTVSTPHTYNDVDTFNQLISHGGGQRGAYMGPAWYRKHFTVPESMNGRKLFLEFEGMRQAGQIFLNGNEVGLYENGVTAYGLDITDHVRFGSAGNVLAVRVENSHNYAEKATGTGFEWEANDFNPNYGGINRHVWLHVTGKIHQTLPLYEGLQTSGTYVFPTNISVETRTADINVETQVANDSGGPAPVALSVALVDSDGRLAAHFDGQTATLPAGEKTILRGTGRLTNARLWSPDDPALYTVYTVLTVDGKVADVATIRTGFRKVDFRGGAQTGGIYINDQFTWLTGYSQRASDEWAGLGQACPDWMHDLTARLVRDSNGNYVRWMHISPQRVDVDAFDRAGIVEVCPAGDKEKDAQGVQWEQRMHVMRDSIVYYRNSPSVVFWEAGNNGISADHLRQMIELKNQWDPSGGRAMGCRSLTDSETTPIAQYFGVMVGQDARTDKLKGPDDTFRGYSARRRDRAPLIETEDFRDEGARRFWDDFSPPHFGFKPGPNDTYHWNSETFALAAVGRYWEYWSNRISNSDPAHARWSGYASIYFSDSNADGRQDSSEVCRVSGKVDAVRLPKEIYFASRVMQNPRSDIHILGHWTYPPGTKKTMYVISNCQAVELLLDGKSLGKSDHPDNGFSFAFPDIHFAPGILKAVGYKEGKAVCEHTLTTAGPSKAIKLTPHIGPRGLQADGADVCLFDVEVVDAEGRRCPTDEGRIDFALTGPASWRGGYNSGKINSTNNTYLDTECGINRVAIRTTETAGAITLTARREDLAPASVEVSSIAASDPLAALAAGAERR